MAGLKKQAVQVARRVSKSLVASALHYSGLRGLLATAQRRSVGGRRVLILSYHRVISDQGADETKGLPTLNIKASTFRRHLEQLQESYDIVPLDEAVAILNGTAQGTNDVAVITFDDGYRDVYNHAFPIMREMGVPGVVYVPSGFVGTGRRLLHDRLWEALQRMETRRLTPNSVGLQGEGAAWLRKAAEGADSPNQILERLIFDHPTSGLLALADALEERLGLKGVKADEGQLNMTWEQLRELNANGVEVGAHTVDHTVLTHESMDSVRAEMARCKQTLEAGLRAPVRHFAYCNGWYSPGVAKVLQDLGFATAVTTEDLPNVPGVDPFALKRKVLWENSSAGVFGTYSPTLTACQFDDVFGALSLQTPVIGVLPTQGEAQDEARTQDGAALPSRPLSAHG